MEHIEERQDPMEISVKSFQEFRANYSDKLGLVLLGAGEPHEEWSSGLADLLVDECDAVQPVFSEAFALSGNVRGPKGRTDLVLVVSPESKVNVGKLAMFRIRFGDASWLDDFAVNYGKDYGYLTGADEEAEDDDAD